MKIQNQKAKACCNIFSTSLKDCCYESAQTGTNLEARKHRVLNSIVYIIGVSRYLCVRGDGDIVGDATLILTNRVLN